MERKKEAIKAGFEIFLLVCSVFAFAYIVKDVKEGPVEVKIGKMGIVLGILKLLVKLVFSDRNFVSALEVSDLANGVATCSKGKDGSICQEYAASECDSKCDSECFPATRDKTPGCALGQCFDSVSGICSEGVPENVCKAKAGKWEKGKMSECEKACCKVGEQVRPLVSARECEYIGETRGIETNYLPEIKNELFCLAEGGKKVEGACIYGSEDAKICRFKTKGECLDGNGDFFPGILCTHSELNMDYEKQATAKCVDDKLYWFDSEGNRENIYDADKDRSWNDGGVLLASESCELGNLQDPMRNQDSCGNCNRLLGSVCGQKTKSEKVEFAEIDFVCKDMRCEDRNGNMRENMESWCEYQGAVGSDAGVGFTGVFNGLMSAEGPKEGFLRAIDTPGSSHFRATCIDGEIQIDRCGDGYRNQICVEKQVERNDKKEISTAACETNLWQLCLSYNSDVEGKGKEREESLEERDKKCVENPHCILKKVNVDTNFKFDLCVPKFSPGFDLQKNAEGGALSCAFASQKCTIVYVKGIDGWHIVSNKGCLEPKFTEQMNDLCMSLGDCGASVNYIGDYSESFDIKGKAMPPTNAYVAGIKKYSDTINGQYIDAGNVTEYFNAIGGIERLGGEFKDPTPEELGIGGTISGVGGVAIIYGLSAYATAIGPTLGAVGGALAGAAIGFAVTALLIKYTGIGAGLDPAVTWALVGGGVVAGAIIGASMSMALASGAGIFGALAAVPIVGWIILIIVIIIIIVLTAIGVGDTKKREAIFECKPWQPQLGGDKCGECGSDGYSCSKYACQSLGVNCRLLNEGEGDKEACYNIGKDDVSAPVIEPWDEVLTPGFKYERTGNGMKIVSEENDGCLRANQMVLFGIKLNEMGQCRYNAQQTADFDKMLDGDGDNGDFSFGLFLQNHTNFIELPDMTSLVPGYDPLKKADYNLFVRCIDGNGNGKNFAEYVINMCIKPGEDIQPPAINSREPASEYVRYGQEKLEGSVMVNEPATCKWSLDSNKKYDEMENEMECANDIIDRNSIFGWRCETTFNIDKEENKFYIKCKDQPWYGVGWQGEGSDSIAADEAKRNEMPEAYEFIVKKTITPLKIDSITPNNETIIFGFVPASVILEVKTSGGIDEMHICKLGESNMESTYGVVHKQTFNQIIGGSYKFNIACEDRVGNSVSASAQFKAEIDVTPPTVTRVYNKGGNLIVITNEDGECAYVNNGEDECNFDFKDGKIMSGVEKTHVGELEKDLTYYIKCKDKYDKIPGGCSVVVRGGVFA